MESVILMPAMRRFSETEASDYVAAPKENAVTFVKFVSFITFKGHEG
jgi:hypothetical protein